MRILTITTDFGLSDWYVAAMKGVIATRLETPPPIVDLSHDVPPGAVATASFLLAAAAPTFPDDTVHLAVVDPGVGSPRRILAGAVHLLDAGDGRRRRQLVVAPDNGLLTGVLDAAARDCSRDGTRDETRDGTRDRGDERPEIVAVDRPDLWRDAPGSTFHGRDRFAPVAAALLAGATLGDLGEPVEPVRLDHPPPRRGTLRGDEPHRENAPHADGTDTADSTDTAEGRVAHIDRFGNLITDIPVRWLIDPDTGEPSLLEVSIGGHTTDLWVTHYLQIPDDRAAALAGSLGTLELSLNGDSLAERWRVAQGMRVRVRRGATVASPPRSPR